MISSTENIDKRYWYALYTRSRYEKKVESALRKIEIGAFLPLKDVIRNWSDRKKLIQEPLFSSYVFVYANKKERFLSLTTPGVVRMVGFNGQPSRIPDSQIDAVRRILECGYSTEDYAYLSKGEEVEIISGPLTGVRGYVAEKRGKKHFVISVDGICKSISINIDARNLRPIQKKAMDNILAVV